MSLLACPDCAGRLEQDRCASCHRVFESDEGVLRLRGRDDAPSESERSYLALYERRPDPWRYEGRAAEVLKADAVMSVVDRLLRPGAKVVEVGCATGHITRRLATRPLSLVCFDLIPAAVTTTQRSLDATAVKASIEWCTASAVHLPVARNSIDLILLLDGPVSWKLGPDGFDRVLSEALAALAPRGRILVMDYLTPSRFEELRGPVERRLRMIETHPLPDRPWYILESALKALQTWRPVRWLLSRLGLARALFALGRLFGEAGSKHLLLVCEPPG